MDKHGFSQEYENEEQQCVNQRGMSTFGAILCTVGSFVGAALVFVILGVDFEKVPVIAIFLVIAVCAVIIRTIAAMRKR